MLAAHSYVVHTLRLYVEHAFTFLPTWYTKWATTVKSFCFLMCYLYVVVLSVNLASTIWLVLSCRPVSCLALLSDNVMPHIFQPYYFTRLCQVSHHFQRPGAGDDPRYLGSQSADDGFHLIRLKLLLSSARLVVTFQLQSKVTWTYIVLYHAAPLTRWDMVRV